MFAASLAGSSFFNGDTTLFVAAAKAAPASKLVWQQFRIPLIYVENGTHFCTPSTTATVLAPLRIGAAPAGRLFVAFNSFENSTTTGSILSFSLASLLSGGPAKVKCFMDPSFAYAQPPDVRDGSTTAYFLDAPIAGTVVHRFALNIGAGVSNDTFAATPDITVPYYGNGPAAVQPNGFHIYPCCGSWFRRPTIQIGNSLWNVHSVDEGSGHPKVRFYKFDATATAPLVELSFNTRVDGTDDLISPSLDTDSDAPGTEAYVTFVRTIAGAPVGGKATLMQARGPNDSASGWTANELYRSPGQFTQDAFGNPCDSFEWDGCAYGPDTATVIDPANSLVWSTGEIIINGTVGGAGSTENWVVKSIGVPR